VVSSVHPHPSRDSLPQETPEIWQCDECGVVSKHDCGIPAEAIVLSGTADMKQIDHENSIAA
jgi:hypothetical protein